MTHHLAPAAARLISPSAMGRALPTGRHLLSSTARTLAADSSQSKELGVGELEGAEFKVAPLRRVGENDATMRARLVYQSRKRGTLESDLLLSTFAATRLRDMTRPQLEAYDRFLDENDWDIYYWATQGEPSSDAVGKGTPAGGLQGSEPYGDGTPSADSSTAAAAEQSANKPHPRPGEWAQTVGTFKPAYRPVPQRWRDSEILAQLREHVRARSAEGTISGATGGRGREDGAAEGMAFMPPLGERGQ